MLNLGTDSSESCDYPVYGEKVGRAVVSGEAEVPVSVLTEAIQTIGDKSIVFIKVPDGFVAQPVALGRSDGKYIEVVSGMKAGTPYAASGSFVLKSELGKGSAEHSH